MRSTARASSERSVVAAPSMASDVAVGTGSSSGRSDTLSPMPMTAAGARPWHSTRSTRIPASLRSSTMTSFGHLRSASTCAWSRIVAATTSPTRSGSHGQRPASTPVGRTSSDIESPDRAGALQVRPRRPRPAVWCSAISTTPSSSVVRARSTRSAFVDGEASVTATSVHSPRCVTRARRSDSACSGGRSRSSYREVTAATLRCRL